MGKPPFPNIQCNGRNGEIREVYRKACREVERSLILEVCREAKIGNLDEAEKEKCCPKTQMWIVILRSAVPIGGRRTEKQPCEHGHSYVGGPPSPGLERTLASLEENEFQEVDSHWRQRIEREDKHTGRGGGYKFNSE